MRDRDAASDGRAEASKTAANTLRVACLAVALMLAQIADTSMARAAETCAGSIMAARTAAKLELAIIACFKMKLTIELVRAELEKKAVDLASNKSDIPFFFSELPPISLREEGDGEVSIISSIESPGMRPYGSHMGYSLKPSGEVNWLVLEISDHPI